MISVLLTTYNDAAYLNDSINSVLNQSFSDFEFIIIDDGSIDDTEKVIRNFADKRIHYYKINHVGRSKALNYGLEKCNRDWVAIIDADDIWHPDKLSRQSIYLKNNNSFTMTYSAFFIKNRIKFVEEPGSSSIEFKKKMILHPGFSHTSVIYNRLLIISIGGYNEELKNAVDYDLWLRLINKVNFYVVEDYLVFVRINYNSLSRKYSELLKSNIRKIQNQNFNETIFDNNQNFYVAWQEYFFGQKKLARKVWQSNKKFFLKDYRITFAFFITYLPDSLFEKFLQLRVRLKIEYLVKNLLRDAKVLNAKKSFHGIITK